MTPSALSQIVRENSKVNPSRGTLRFLELLVLEGKPAKVAAPGSTEEVLLAKLEAMPTRMRKALVRAFMSIIETVYCP